jgi:hypothetical protein
MRSAAAAISATQKFQACDTYALQDRLSRLAEYNETVPLRFNIWQRMLAAG